MINQELSEKLRKLRETANAAGNDQWYAGPVQEDDEYGGAGGVSIGPYDLVEKYGQRPDFSPEKFNDHYESQVAYVSGQNQVPEHVAAHIVATSPANIIDLVNEVEEQLANNFTVNITNDGNIPWDKLTMLERLDYEPEAYVRALYWVLGLNKDTNTLLIRSRIDQCEALIQKVNNRK